MSSFTFRSESEVFKCKSIWTAPFVGPFALSYCLFLLLPVNKQINDKERVSAALENPMLLQLVEVSKYNAQIFVQYVLWEKKTVFSLYFSIMVNLLHVTFLGLCTPAYVICFSYSTVTIYRTCNLTLRRNLSAHLHVRDAQPRNS